MLQIEAEGLRTKLLTSKKELQDQESRVGFRVYGLGFRVSGLGSRV